MTYTAELWYNDTSDTLHSLSRTTATAEDGAILVHKWLFDLMTDWSSIDPCGLKVSATVTSSVGDYCDVYEFSLGV